jgi:hypothetical protein
MDKDEIIAEILRLKSKKEVTQKDKLTIQLLQQELGRLDER